MSFMTMASVHPNRMDRAHRDRMEARDRTKASVPLPDDDSDAPPIFHGMAWAVGLSVPLWCVIGLAVYAFS